MRVRRALAGQRSWPASFRRVRLRLPPAGLPQSCRTPSCSFAPSDRSESSPPRPVPEHGPLAQPAGGESVSLALFNPRLPPKKRKFRSPPQAWPLQFDDVVQMIVRHIVDHPHGASRSRADHHLGRGALKLRILARIKIRSCRNSSISNFRAAASTLAPRAASISICLAATEAHHTTCIVPRGISTGPFGLCADVESAGADAQARESEDADVVLGGGRKRRCHPAALLSRSPLRKYLCREPLAILTTMIRS